MLLSEEKRIDAFVLQLPKDDFGVVLVRSDHQHIAPEFLVMLANQVNLYNPRLMTVGMFPGTSIDMMSNDEVMNFVSLATDRFSTEQLAKLGLKRITN
jgi:hypothetical protein